MKNPPSPPSKPPKKPMTAKRQKIMALAMAQLKKTRAQMDPKILGKIREIIAKNPKVMKGLGIDKMPEEPKLTPMTKQEIKPTPVKAKVEANVNGAEKIDQAKNMEVIAKLMQLKPSEIKNIKSVLLKTKD